MLKQEYKEEEMALKDALKLAVKVLDKTLDITKLTPDKGEFTLSSIKSALQDCFNPNMGGSICIT